MSFYQSVYRYDTDGELLNRVGRFVHGEYFVWEVPDRFGRIAYWNRAFGRSTTILGTPGGFALGDGSVAEVSYYTHDGRLKEVVRSAGLQRSVTPSDIAMYRQTELAKASPRRRELVEIRVKEMPYPEVYPAYRRFFIDPLERIWLESFPQPGKTADEWVVLDRTLNQQVRLTMPRGFHALAVSERMICGLTFSEYDEESIACYGLEDRSVP